jgi:hypothetical protein
VTYKSSIAKSLLKLVIGSTVPFGHLVYDHHSSSPCCFFMLLAHAAMSKINQCLARLHPTDPPRSMGEAG